MTSCAQPGSDGARSTSLASCGSTKRGIDETFLGFTVRVGALIAALSPPPFLLLSQTAPAARFLPVMKGVGARPLPTAISSRVRPEATESGLSFSSVS